MTPPVYLICESQAPKNTALGCAGSGDTAPPNLRVPSLLGWGQGWLTESFSACLWGAGGVGGDSELRAVASARSGGERKEGAFSAGPGSRRPEAGTFGTRDWGHWPSGKADTSQGLVRGGWGVLHVGSGQGWGSGAGALGG